MVSTHLTRDMPGVQAWLTNVQMSLLSEADTQDTAAMLQRANGLVKTRGDTEEGADGNQPVLELQVGVCLDRGIKRKSKPNEDSLFVTQGVLHVSSSPPRPFALFIVADGMGGHVHGQEASQLAVQSLVEHVYAAFFSKQMPPDAFLPLLEEGVQHANQIVYRYNREHETTMGTTITATLVVGTTAYVANVGDSRTYLYRPSAGLSRITRDHSVVAALAEAGIIKPSEIYTHPRRNQIYRSLGEKPVVQVDTFVVALAEGDTLLLCSDGLWEMVRDPQIAGILTSARPDPSTTATLLVQAALEGGGADNVSVIVARVS